jgi:peptidoglycan/LPS O-acetylase OafA/YrhL
LKSANLDLLRAAAVLSVFLAHLSGATHFRRMESLGNFGVVMFFVHTCLVLNASLERLELGGFGTGWRLATAFWIRRFFRIYPLAIFFVTLTAIFQIPYSPGRAYEWVGAKALVANLTLMQNLFNQRDVLGTLWTLPLEVQMYGILPFAYLVVRCRTRYGAAVLWIVAVLLALTMPRLSGRLGVFSYAPCFTAGIVAFDLRRNIGWKLPAWIWPVAILTCIVLFGPLDNADPAAKLTRAWILSLVLGIFAASAREIEWHRLNTATHWVAEYSYGIYLSHFVVFWLALDVMAARPVWVRGLFLVTASVAVPVVCYRVIEKPLIAAGGSLARLLRPERSCAEQLLLRT